MTLAVFLPDAPPGPGPAATGVMRKKEIDVSAQTWQSTVVITNPEKRSWSDEAD